MTELGIVQTCDMWIHNECSFIAETQYETVNNTNCTWICPKFEFFIFSDSFFGEQVNLETENRFVPLTKETTHHKGKKLPSVYVLGDFNFTGINFVSVKNKEFFYSTTSFWFVNIV